MSLARLDAYKRYTYEIVFLHLFAARAWTLIRTIVIECWKIRMLVVFCICSKRHRCMDLGAFEIARDPAGNVYGIIDRINIIVGLCKLADSLSETKFNQHCQQIIGLSAMLLQICGNVTILNHFFTMAFGLL